MILQKDRPDTSVLDGVAPFDRYPARSLRPLAPHADRVHVRPGTVVAREAHLAREFVVVVSGELIESRDGREVGRLGPGTQVGATEVLDGTPHAATLIAGTDLEVLVIDAPAYRWAAQTLPGLPLSA